ncbi:anticodon-binding domain-domain-containing protein [Leucosporidium creatinivorum]|uniref:Anticodon-binding domain-domain-containing protein n=1 Tax=Leucosporidium creatinivorum TaxID=106004 RepID=A0A1Y2FN63_9BASI|nr:anticodon-binding domain-domain-containing protein [Leucosporidium creatinivorum]
MSTKPSTPSGSRKASSSTPAAGGGGSKNSRRGSATASPKPGGGAGMSQTSANAVATPTPPAAAASTTTTGEALPDLTTLLNLPLRVVIAASGELPQREVEGTLWTYDPLTSFVVLTTPSASASSAASSQPQTAQNPPSQKRSYHLIKSTQIKAVTILSLTPDTSLPAPSSLLRAINPAEVSARVEKAVLEDQKARARVGQGVSDEAQALFDALGRTLPVRWAGKNIVVMDEVMIAEPYGVGDVKGGKGAGGYVERVKKVLEGERQRRAARQIGFP